MQIDKLQYIFDPLCGWCYASAPALSWLAETYPDKLELLPSGLFCDEGARQITAEWANHAWTNDQRIASLTGQIYSEDYHQLLLSHARFDSQSMNRALTIFNAISPAAEAGLLHTLQSARYVEGQDTSRSEVVAKISTDYAKAHHFSAVSDGLLERIESDETLRQQTDARTGNVKRMLNAKGLRGVPMLLVTVGGVEHLVNGHDLYGGAESINNALLALTQ